eukprot:1897567-Pleurochrysis_carterae.AAC.2
MSRHGCRCSLAASRRQFRRARLHFKERSQGEPHGDGGDHAEVTIHQNGGIHVAALVAAVVGDARPNRVGHCAAREHRASKLEDHGKHTRLLDGERVARLSAGETERDREHRKRSAAKRWTDINSSGISAYPQILALRHGVRGGGVVVRVCPQAADARPPKVSAPGGIQVWPLRFVNDRLTTLDGAMKSCRPNWNQLLLLQARSSRCTLIVVTALETF